MLTHLHVKNLALIREVEIDFTEGLNILTGETGAGKSIVIGSVSLALGGKVSREMVRPGADYGLAELVFLVNREKQKEKLLELGITPEEDQVIISRKISDGRSINKINGETVTLSQLRETASLLIDVHGQHEHQSLLQKKKHLEILDEFAKEELGPVKEKLAGAFQNWKKLKKQLQEAQMDEESRLREISLLEFETDEIGKAELVPGEDEELERRYRRMTNARKLMEAAGSAYALTGYEEESGAGAVIGRAVRELQSAASFDEELSGLASLLSDVDGLLNDFNREMSDYLTSLEFDEKEFSETEERLNLLNYLKSRYGHTLEEILAYQEKQEQRLAALQDYDRYLQDLEAQLKKAEEELQDLCAEASGIRQRYGKMLCEKIKEHLIDLNFLNVEFEMAFEELPEYTAQGKDSAEFLISTNPGEPLRPLMKIASGGELSRIMLAIKTVLADRDEIDTVIFDEIDVGISGRTAQKVSEKMMLIGRTRQVICITHLAQIAAMADSHYRIEKQVEEGETRTQIRRLSEKESIEELARILGGAEITDAVTKNAEEMRALALERKQSR
ncbi:MAG TPA: DNA repair protein RecN [Candidatus Merdisoma faecalis]|uniref:DNA repair protein RecN n=1 Tax=Lachnoclostridium sp. An138 TaxID=1965560 RepID=UPI000B3849F2|nr:DNA repair protein RecN [Lachnoclostridium sp. An138]OUQ17311.1 DNA repair protein RecN [Lachnoclostridium sp. An138]HIR98556.1 DNA repair protein RecN [Candidatus Merdisoma faecalis]